ncbi:MAG: T9SS type A sorting domain-containing protein [Bacteroidales bacterium]|nr:T9SS type A sorting domain-containing protein [Bacteroidales bacterium]
MKRLIFTFVMALAMSVSTYALDNIMLDDFEADSVSFTTEVHVNPPAHMDIAVVDNPVKAGINTSNKVWRWTRYDASPDNKSWAGFWAILKNAVPTGYHRIEVKYLRTNATSQLRIKCEGAVTMEMNPVTPATKTNEWETMVFDLYANGIKNITVFGMFPDYYEPVDPTAVTYVDDIKVIFDPTINPPIPTMLTLFDNSANNRFHDQSWVNQTAPSTVVTENWEGPNIPNGDKMPCVTSPVKSGANALKLQWKSVDTGDWMALVASVGWKPFDLMPMTDLKFWVNSPVAITKNALPDFYFEAFSGAPNKTGKVSMGAYLKSDIAANTWTEVTVPLKDIWAADTAFKAKDVIKGIFFAQKLVDNVEHTLFMDDFTFVRDTTPPDQVLFDHSANGRFHDQSWINQTAPSTVVTENWEGPNMANGDKFPVVASPVKEGENALKLQWKSVPAGDWMAMVAAVGWASFDVTKMTHFSFWVNSPVTLTKAVMPKLNFEAHSGNPNATGKLDMGNYLSADVPANTWTEVKIPLADFWATNAAFTSQGMIKGLFFSQNATDNVEHTMYLDAFKFIFDKTNGINPTYVDKTIKAYYANGELRMLNYSGEMRIFDIAGKMVAQQNNFENSARVNLRSGIYIVNTSRGNAKIAVK